MNDKEYKRIMKESGSHSWTDEELKNVDRGVTLLTLTLIAVIVIIWLSLK